jgi:hypothetical protein
MEEQTENIMSNSDSRDNIMINQPGIETISNEYSSSESNITGIENSITIDIDEEKSLIDYTNHEFTRIATKGNRESDIVYNSHYNHYIFGSDSPLTMSNNNSSDESDSDDEDKNYKKLSYKNIEKSLSKYYDVDDKYSDEFDILLTYLKGQKNLYVFSKHITQQKLNALILPSLLIVAAIAIFAPFIENYQWNTVIISALNALVTFLIGIANYLRLESSCEKYVSLATQYDKLETSLEMTSHKLMFITNENEHKTIILDKIKELDKKINEIRELNTILIPCELEHLFPIICNINIFSVIKKIELHKRSLIVKFKDVKNEIRYIVYKLNHVNKSEKSRLDNRLTYLIEIKETIKSEIIHCKKSFNCIDSIFSREIIHAEYRKNRWFLYWIFGWKNNNSYDSSQISFINQFLSFTFARKKE